MHGVQWRNVYIKFRLGSFILSRWTFYSGRLPWYVLHLCIVMVGSQCIYTFSRFLRCVFVSELGCLLLHNKHLPDMFNSRQRQYVGTKPVYLQNLYLSVCVCWHTVCNCMVWFFSLLLQLITAECCKTANYHELHFG